MIMQKLTKPKQTSKGIALVIVIIFMLILTLTSITFLLMSQTETKNTALDEAYVSAFYLAEAGAERAIWELKQDINWQPTCSENNPIMVKNGSYWIERKELGSRDSPNGTITTIRIIATGRGGKKGMLKMGSGMRRIEIEVDLSGAGSLSDVFDYVYFLNNWGWWFWGGGDNSNGTAREWSRGEMRSNGRFDFQPVSWANRTKPPRIDDDIYAHFQVDMHGYPVRGVGGTITYQHPNSPKSIMPNLQQPDFYKNLAKEEDGKVYGYNYSSGTNTILIDEVHGDSPGEHDSIILIGTSQNPITLNGPVYVQGNVIIKGTITGQGAIYAGRNIYIAGNITYKNPPVGTNGTTPCPFPQTTKNTLTTDDQEVKDWYNRNKGKDVIALAAAENIVLHNYTSSSWYSDTYGLFTMGSEDVGQDGIPDTGDTGENDGEWDILTEDLDGDKTPDMNNYSWKDITTSGGNSKNSDPLNNFDNRPKVGGQPVTHYSAVCNTSGINILNGVYYTQHAMAGRLLNSPIFNGSVISKDEVMVYSGGLLMNYDFRYHRNFRSNPNWPIHLNLPPTDTGSNQVTILSWKEVKL